jgi:hypothetical protein
MNCWAKAVSFLTKSRQNQSAPEYLQQYQHYQQVHIHEEAMAVASVRVVRQAVCLLQPLGPA